MRIIQTKSFKLATHSKGDNNAPKFALVIPGKLDTKDYAHMRSHVDFLASLGFFALSFDPPGTWESPGSINLYTMSNYLKAVDEVIEYYGNKPTFIAGHSRGATISIISASRNKNIYAYCSIMSSFSKGGFTRRHDSEWKTKGFVVSKRDLPPGGGPKIKEFKVYYDFNIDERKFDLNSEITDSVKPKLFFLGKTDGLIPPDKIRDTFKLFANPKELYEIDCGHDYRLYPEKIKEIEQVIGRFLVSINI